jgi:hypothetical protein
MDKQMQAKMIEVGQKCGSKLARRVGVQDKRDAQQVGALAALEAVDTYNPARGTPETWAAHCAIQAVRAHLYAARLPVKVRWRDYQDSGSINACPIDDAQHAVAEELPADVRFDRDHAGAEAAELLAGLVGTDPVRQAVVAVLLEGTTKTAAQQHLGLSQPQWGEAERGLRRRVRLDAALRDCWDRLNTGI